MVSGSNLPSKGAHIGDRSDVYQFGMLQRVR